VNEIELSSSSVGASVAPEKTPPCRPRARPRSRANQIQADAALARRCVSGEVAAWEALYAQCHERLCLSVKILLGSRDSDGNLIDEIAARVWYALVANDGDLLSRFDPAHGARLVTFMRALAKDEIGRHFRAELRRRERELIAARKKGVNGDEDLAESVSSMREFLATLTPHERSFCDEFLMAAPDEAEREGRTPASIWQLTHRVYRKFLRFFERRG
jgi:hypothetical protein